MAKLTTAKRKKLPKSKFALESERKYPIDTKARAANAKARAQQQYDKGNISLSMLKEIDREADKVLKKEVRKTVAKKSTSTDTLKKTATKKSAAKKQPSTAQEKARKTKRTTTKKRK